MDMTETDKEERFARQKKELELRAKKRNSRLFLLAGSIFEIAETLAVILLLFISVLREKSLNIRLTLSTFPFPIRWLLFLLMILSIIIFGVWGTGYNEAAFLYYQF